MYTTAAQAELRQHYLEGCKDVWLALDQVAIPCSFSFGRNVYQAWCPMGRVMHMCPPCLPNLPVPELHIQNGKDWLECEIHTVPSHSLLVWMDCTPFCLAVPLLLPNSTYQTSTNHMTGICLL